MIRFDEDSSSMKDWQNFHSKTFSLYQISEIFDVYFVSYYNKVQAQKRRAPAGTLFPFRFLVNTIGGQILDVFLHLRGVT